MLEGALNQVKCQDDQRLFRLPPFPDAPPGAVAGTSISRIHYFFPKAFFA